MDNWFKFSEEEPKHGQSIIALAFGYDRLTVGQYRYRAGYAIGYVYVSESFGYRFASDFDIWAPLPSSFICVRGGESFHGGEISTWGLSDYP